MAKRTQLEMDENEYEKLGALMKKCGIRTKKEMFRSALALFEWCADKRSKGYDIIAKNEDREIEFDMPALSAIPRDRS